MTALRDFTGRYRVTAEPLRTERRIELAVVVLGLLLLLQLGFGALGVFTLGPPAAVAPAAGSLQLPGVDRAESASEQEREAIAARPLFWAGRRPVAPGAAEEEARESKHVGELGGVRVVGIFADGATEGVIALVKDSKRRILLGEELDGWTLQAVRPTEADFANGPRRETIPLDRNVGATVADSGAVTSPQGAPPPATGNRRPGRAARATGAAGAAGPGSDPARIPAAAAAGGSGGSGGLSLGVQSGSWMQPRQAGTGPQSAGGAEKDK